MVIQITKGLVDLEVQTNDLEAQINKYYLRALSISNSEIFVLKKNIEDKENIVLQFKNGSCIKIIHYNPNDYICGYRMKHTYFDDLF